MAKRRSQQPENREAEAPKVPRNKRGQFVGGGPSPNPGGISAKAVDLRRKALASAGKALDKAIEMIDDPDPEVAAIGINHVLSRALGRPSAPAELPDDSPLPPQIGTPSSQELLDRALRLCGNSLARIEAKVAAGEALPDTTLEAISEQARTLALLAKEERELAKSGPGARLSDEDLINKILGSLSVEQLRAALEKREATP